MNQRPSLGATRWLALGLFLAASACSGDALGPNQGRVHFTLSSGSPTTVGQAVSQPSTTLGGDSAADPTLNEWEREHDYRFFETANVTLSSILARNQDGELVGVTMDLPATVDVVAMDHGGEISLPDADLPAGTYDQLVVVMTHVEGVAHDSTQITLTPPGGGWTSIVPVCPFTVEDGGTTTVSLQFMVHRAFVWSGSHFRFHPEFQCGSEDEGSND